MEDIILDAIERVKQPGRFKETGFVPGVLYGDGVKGSTTVKFDEIAIRKIISNHGANAKIWIKYKSTKKFGFIKEVQRNPVTRMVSHIDIQMVSTDHEIRLMVPVVFTGEESLKNRQLQLQVHRSEVAILGKMGLMPDEIVIDVSENVLGDTISIDVDKELKVEETLVAMIVHLKVLNFEEPEADAATETETKEEAPTA